MRSRRSRQTLSSKPPPWLAEPVPHASHQPYDMHANLPLIRRAWPFGPSVFKPALSHAVQLSPCSFIKMTLGAPTGVDVDQLKAENEQLRKKSDELTLKLEEVQAKLAEAEGSGEA